MAEFDPNASIDELLAQKRAARSPVSPAVAPEAQPPIPDVPDNASIDDLLAQKRAARASKVDSALAKGAGSTTVHLEPDGTQKMADKPLTLPDPKHMDVPETVVQGKHDPEQGSTVNVTFVEDGDTFHFKPKDGQEVPNAVKNDQGKFVCRIDSIDTPETDHSKPERGISKPGQPGGLEAKAALEDLVKKGDVTIKIAKNSSSYGRNICQVQINGVGVDEEMVRKGLAWVIGDAKKFTDASRRATLEGLQKKNFDSAQGIFGMTGSMEPYKWRRHFWPKADEENE